MKRWMSLLLSLTCLLGLVGCQTGEAGTAKTEITQKPKVPLPRMVMVDGVLYEDTGRISTEPRCGVMDGEIEKAVENWEVPEEDDQSNFGTGYGYQRWPEDEVHVYMDEQWRVFAIERDWGIELTAENVSPTGLTLICSQSDGKVTGMLMTGRPYWVEYEKDGVWVPADELVDEVCWTSDGLEIKPGGTTKWSTNWENIYGSLVPGVYRIGKEIMDLRSPGDYDKSTFYAYFAITE